MARTAGPKGRELRLDAFRGLALIFIYLDHIPSNLLNWITIRNFGFSDATEIFIFISGYTATVAYGNALRRRGFLFATSRILRRCWQLYAAHIFLFVIFTAQIGYVAATFHNQMFAEEMNITGFLSEPHVALMQALLLRFMPANMDVLPLYIVLLLAFPLILWGMQISRIGVLALSLALYVVARHFDWNIATYPDGDWFFNPFAWQLLFVIGAACGKSHGTGERLTPAWPWLPWVALAYLVFAFLIVLTWHVPQLERFVPDLLQRFIYPIDKSALDPLRLLHFLALAYLTVLLVPAGARILDWRIVKPVIACGQQSLYIFCAGIFLSFAAHFILEEINGSTATQIAVSAGGIVLMVALAYMILWYKSSETAPALARAAEPSDGRVERAS
ncbi:MAG TPA: OpgC domain-containing protein [Candidatus Cybelea sp.]|nr:OpgC domain-containing protein [Candidatus Cybelea sp.]